MKAIRLGQFDNSWYRPGRPRWQQIAWFVAGLPLLRSANIPSSKFRVWLLRSFGATVGNGAVIKPGVRVKYPWHLRMGSDCWLGEDCWIDNLAAVTLGSDVCISQGAYLCTGNHDWSDPAFGLRTEAIGVGDGGWVGARAMLGPGAQLGEGAVAAAGSVVTGGIPAWEVHGGNPAVFLRKRLLKSAADVGSKERERQPRLTMQAAGAGQ